MVHSHFSSDNGKPNEERQFNCGGDIDRSKELCAHRL